MYLLFLCVCICSVSSKLELHCIWLTWPYSLASSFDGQEINSVLVANYVYTQLPVCTQHWYHFQVQGQSVALLYLCIVQPLLTTTCEFIV